MTLYGYLSLFPGASREKDRFMALAEAVLRQVTDLIPVTLGALSNYSFLTAEGEALDQLAAVFGLGRVDTASGIACTDADFRAYLLAKLALWTWDGTDRDVPTVLARAGITKSQTDRMDGTVGISLSGTMPRAEARLVFPYPAGILGNMNS